jgi:hypothetical protein
VLLYRVHVALMVDLVIILAWDVSCGNLQSDKRKENNAVTVQNTGCCNNRKLIILDHCEKAHVMHVHVSWLPGSFPDVRATI